MKTKSGRTRKGLGAEAGAGAKRVPRSATRGGVFPDVFPDVAEARSAFVDRGAATRSVVPRRQPVTPSARNTATRCSSVEALPLLGTLALSAERWAEPMRGDETGSQFRYVRCSKRGGSAERFRWHERVDDVCCARLDQSPAGTTK